jgi:hypothetical protein
VPAVVQSWSSDTIVAMVGANSVSGFARVLQGCLITNALPFTVPLPHIDSVAPSSAAPGSNVTITGSGFGSSAGSVQLGDRPADVVNWTDIFIVATVASGALSGIGRQQLRM